MKSVAERSSAVDGVSKSEVLTPSAPVKVEQFSNVPQNAVVPPGSPVPLPRKRKNVVSTVSTAADDYASKTPSSVSSVKELDQPIKLPTQDKRVLVDQQNSERGTALIGCMLSMLSLDRLLWILQINRLQFCDFYFTGSSVFSHLISLVLSLCCWFCLNDFENLSVEFELKHELRRCWALKWSQRIEWWVCFQLYSYFQFLFRLLTASVVRRVVCVTACLRATLFLWLPISSADNSWIAYYCCTTKDILHAI